MTLNISEIREIMLNLLKGIKHLKENKIVHRDLKPYNIIFKDQNDFSSLKILDFGLSCTKFESSKAFKICGTPGFMAPEMFYTKGINGWSVLDSNIDVFSAGVIFHYYLFERLIYEEKGKILISCTKIINTI